MKKRPIFGTPVAKLGQKIKFEGDCFAVLAMTTIIGIRGGFWKIAKGCYRSLLEPYRQELRVDRWKRSIDSR